MVFGRVDAVFLRGERPGTLWGLGTIVVLVVLLTLLGFPLAHVTQASSLGVVYLLGVLLVAMLWGLRLGTGMAFLSAATFNFFHLPPAGRFSIADSRNWVALVAFVVAAVIVSSVSELARLRALESERRRAEADLTADIAQLLLSQAGLDEALQPIGERLAAVFGLSSATILLGEAPVEQRRDAIPLTAGTERLGVLLVPSGLPSELDDRLRGSVVAALSAVLRAAVERERLIGEAVETEGLKRSEAVKTAVLRAVSHDLRSPVTAVIAAGTAMRSPTVSDRERDELSAAVVQEGTRLGCLIDDLLDLSKLEAQSATPRLTECSLEEVIDAALAEQPYETRFEVEIDPDLPPVMADFVQIERALANLLQNATRFANGAAVTVQASCHGGQVTVRVLDRGPGVPVADRERIFEPFYRSDQPGSTHAGSGLGLAIARGFVETNGGSIWVDSLPGEGSAFVITLPAAQTSLTW